MSSTRRKSSIGHEDSVGLFVRKVDISATRWSIQCGHPKRRATARAIHGFGLRFRGRVVSKQRAGVVKVKFRACFLAWIWSVREPHLEPKIYNFFKNALKQIPIKPCSIFSRFSAPKPQYRPESLINSNFLSENTLFQNHVKKTAFGRIFGGDQR
jgi:hypothetical protein